jgi:hypothetical protein
VAHWDRTLSGARAAGLADSLACFYRRIRRPIFAKGPQFLLLKSWTLANGEVLTGKPKTVKAASVNTPAPDASAPPQPNLGFARDVIDGRGYFVARILGKDFGQGSLRESKERFCKWSPSMVETELR